MAQTYWINGNHLAKVRNIIRTFCPIKNPNFTAFLQNNGVAEMKIYFFSKSNQTVFEEWLSSEDIGFARI